MNLTEEQRRRIEENRRKALEKRAAAAKAASKTNSKASPLQTVSNNQFSFNKQQPQGTVFGGRSHSTVSQIDCGFEFSWGKVLNMSAILKYYYRSVVDW